VVDKEWCQTTLEFDISVTFGASALFVGKGEGHLACKNVCCLPHRLLQNHWKRKAGLPGKGS